jgi:hypothetical protein
MIDDLLIDVCDVHSTSVGQSGMGGRKLTTVSPPVLPNEPTRRRLLRGNEQTLVGREGERTTHRFYFTGGRTIKPTYKIKFGGDWHDVVMPDNPHNMDEFVQVDAILRR